MPAGRASIIESYILKTKFDSQSILLIWKLGFQVRLKDSDCRGSEMPKDSERIKWSKRLLARGMEPSCLLFTSWL